MFGKSYTNASELAKVLKCTMSLGTELSANWTSARELFITISDSTGATLQIGNGSSCGFIMSGNVRNLAATSGPSTSSTDISGSFAIKPLITDISGANVAANDAF